MKNTITYIVFSFIISSFTLSGQYNNLIINDHNGDFLIALPVGPSEFGVGAGDVKVGSLVFADDQHLGVGTVTDACEPILNNVEDAIVLIDRGACVYVDKAQHAIDAGAIAAIICNNTPETDLGTLGGNVANIWIPVLSLTYEDCQTLRMMDLDSLSGSLAHGNIEFHPYWFSGAPNYSTPVSQVDEVPFLADVVNTSDVPLDNISFDVEVVKGNEVLYTASSGNLGPVDKDDRIENIVLDDFWEMIPEVGEYTVNYSIHTTSIVDVNQSNNTLSKKFVVSENTFSKLINDGALRSFVWPRTSLSYANGYYIPNGNGWRPTKLSTGFGTNLYEELGVVKLKAEVREWQFEVNGDGEVDYELETQLLAYGELLLDPENPVDLHNLEIDLKLVDGQEGFVDSGQYLAIIHVVPLVEPLSPVSFGPLWADESISHDFISGPTDFAFRSINNSSLGRPNSMESCFDDFYILMLTYDPLMIKSPLNCWTSKVMHSKRLSTVQMLVSLYLSH